MRVKALIAAASLACAATAAQAVLVQNSFYNSGGSTWIAQFSIYNDGSVPLVESFTIYFDYGKATNLVLLSAPSWWDTLVVQPDDALASPGFLDALQTDPLYGLDVGNNLKGFSVEFQWSGTSAPGPLAYSINDPASFVPLETGATTVLNRDDPGQVPEPAIWGLQLIGLAAVAVARLRRRG